jgi:photosystem II stability/assembly factor-like uncharacterized protein
MLEELEPRALLSTAIPLNPASWTPVGPAPITGGQTPGNQPVSGRIAALAAHPTDPDTIYIAAAGGGVWKTIDGGTHWTPLTDDQPTLFMGAIALAPSNPDIIYAGTGEANNSPNNTFYGRGILKSTNAGASWTLLGTAQFDRQAISEIRVDPTDPNNVYVAVGGPQTNGLDRDTGINTGIWRSTDGGLTFINTTTRISTTAAFTDLEIDPLNPNILYASVGDLFGDAANGVYKTTNNGGSWARAGNIPTGLADGRITTAISPSNPQTIYAAIVGSGQAGSAPFGRLYRMLRSTDGGNFWTDLTAGTPDYFGLNEDAGQGFGWYDSTLAVNPSNPDVVYAGGNFSIIASINGGVTWDDISVGADGNGPHVDHHGIGFDALGRLLDGNDGGLWRLADPNPASVAWTDLNGDLNTIQFIGIALDPTTSNVAYGGSQDNGTNKFIDALGWDHIVDGDGGFVRVDPTNPGTIYQEFFGISLGRSDDGGLNFASATTGIDPDDPANFYVPYVLDASNSSRLLYGTNRVYETLNRGDQWTPISTPFANGWDSAAPIDALATAATDPNTIYASAGGHIFVTTNRGATWQRRDIPGATDSVVDIRVDPANSQVAYAARNRFNGGGNSGHVFRTINGGQTWTDISVNLPDLPVNAIVIDATTAPGVLYVGTDNGVFTSGDGGATWSHFKTGLPNVQVTGLELLRNSRFNILAAGTYGRGLWEITLESPLAGGIDPASDRGVSNSDGITSDNTPSFLGQAAPGAIIRLFADAAGSVLIGQGVADSTGAWGVSTNPLADGVYSFFASAADPDGNLISLMRPLLPSGSRGPLVIDTAGPKIDSVALDPRTGIFRVVFRGDLLSDVDPAALINPANYSLSRPSGRNRRNFAVTSLTVGPDASPVANTVMITFNNGRPVRPGRYVLTISAAGLVDRAGNPLDERSFVPFPGVPAVPGRDFVAQITTDGRTASAPRPFVPPQDLRAAAAFRKFVRDHLRPQRSPR